VNIAMPATLLATGVEWVDLDLDYRVHLDSSVERLNQLEFEQNAQRMKYPLDVIEQTQIACQEVEMGLTSRDYPFDYDQQVERYLQIKAHLLARGE
jgi:protein associated with RNAse G/E